MNAINATSSAMSEWAKVAAHELDNLEPGQSMYLSADDAAYTEPQPVWVRPVAEFDDADAVRAQIGSVNNTRRFVQVFEVATGNRAHFTDFPDGYWTNHKPANQWYQLNRVNRLGDDYLIVGMGEWIVSAETTENGEPAFEFITADEAFRRETTSHAAFEAIARRSKPEWATELEILATNDAGVLDVIFSTTNAVPQSCVWEARASVEQWCAMDHEGTVTDSGTPTPNVFIAENIGNARMSPTDMRAIATGLQRVADEFERIVGQ